MEYKDTNYKIDVFFFSNFVKLSYDKFCIINRENSFNRIFFIFYHSLELLISKNFYIKFLFKIIVLRIEVISVRFTIQILIPVIFQILCCYTSEFIFFKYLCYIKWYFSIVYCIFILFIEISDYIIKNILTLLIHLLLLIYFLFHLILLIY